jgi:hypothetical protein
VGLFGPSTEERLSAASAALQPYGFTVDPRAAPELRRYLPFELLYAPDELVAGVLGRVEGHQVEAYEYVYTYTDSEGGSASSSELVMIAHHPSIVGGACFSPDTKEWDGLAKFLDVLMWVPPFSFVKAIQLYADAKNPDRRVGHAEFDRLFRVRAPSDAIAAAAITPALREAAVRLGQRIVVELRPGHLVVSAQGRRLDENAPGTIGIAIALLAGYARPDGDQK